MELTEPQKTKLLLLKPNWFATGRRVCEYIDRCIIIRSNHKQLFEQYNGNIEFQKELTELLEDMHNNETVLSILKTLDPTEILKFNIYQT